MPLTFTVKNKTSIPIEVDTVRYETVRGQTPDEVKATPVQYGNQEIPLGEFFDVSGSAADDGQLVWRGDCSKVKLIGAHLSEGQIRVEGDAGMHLGAEMTGGEIVVEGNAADWVGAEMHGGLIRVRGNAGHLVGAVYRGGRRGMTGGQILIDGNAGNEIGHTMRRGLIVIGGNTGDAIGFGMIAGSVLVFGNPGIRPGAGMKRGTIGLFAQDAPPDLLPTFKRSGHYRPTFLRFIKRHLQSLNVPVSDALDDIEVDRYCGDFLELGKGEILVSSPH